MTVVVLYRAFRLGAVGISSMGPLRESRHHEEEKTLNRQEHFRLAEGDSLRALICSRAVRFAVGFQIAAMSLEASSISHEQKQSQPSQAANRGFAGASLST